MKPSSRGFTLLEVLISMMIMSGAIAVLATSWYGNIARVEKARINNTTAALLQRKMTEIEIAYLGKPVEEIPEEDSGDFGDAFPQYKWTLESKDFVMPSLSGMLIAREGGADSTLLTVVNQMTEVISKSVKEVRVTLIYTSKRSKKEMKNSITTYFIDYAKDAALGPGGAAGIPGAGDSGAGKSGDGK